MAVPYGFDGGGQGGYGGPAGIVPQPQTFNPWAGSGLFGNGMPSVGGGGGGNGSAGGGGLFNGGMFNLADLIKAFQTRNAGPTGGPQLAPGDTRMAPVNPMPGVPDIDPQTGQIRQPRAPRQAPGFGMPMTPRAPGGGINPTFGNPSNPNGGSGAGMGMRSMGGLLGMSAGPRQRPVQTQNPGRGMLPVPPAVSAY